MYETEQYSDKALTKEFSERRVLVTGGAGFIGSEVVHQLCKYGAQVTILDNFSAGRVEYIPNDRRRVKVIEGDIVDEETVKRAIKDQEIILHTAALPFIPDSYYHPKDFFKVNLEGTLNVLWTSINSENVKKFVLISSSEVYGTARYIPMDEEHPTFPHSTYAASKLAADRATFTIHKEIDFPIVVVRPFNAYGHRFTQPYIIPEIIYQLFLGNSEIQLGKVNASRDFTYVSDTSRGILLAAAQPRAIGEVINLGSQVEVTIRDLALRIARVMGRTVKITTDESRLRPFDVDRLVCDNTKAQRLLGWKPTVPLDEGLAETITWARNHQIVFKSPFKRWYYRTGNAE